MVSEPKLAKEFAELHDKLDVLSSLTNIYLFKDQFLSKSSKALLGIVIEEEYEVISELSRAIASILRNS